MKKQALILIVIFLFSILLVGLNNIFPNTSANPNSNIQSKLTHDEEHIFTMDSFDLPNSQYILTEGNDTITLKMDNEDYFGNNSFTDDNNGEFPIGFTGKNVNVNETMELHHKIVNFTTDIVNDGFILQDTPYNLQNGTFEFWIYSELDTGSMVISIEGDTGVPTSELVCFQFYGYTKQIQYIEGITWHTLGNYVLNTWNHVLCNFDNSTSTYSLTINNTQTWTNIPYRNSGNSTSIVFHSIEVGMSYIDAIDMSWSEGYYQGRNLLTEYFPEGSYVSPILDLGEYNNYFVTYINVSYLTPSDSDITGYAQISTDNITWSGWIPLNGLPNVTCGFEAGRYCQFYFNLTSSTDFLETPELYSLLVQFDETIPNEVPTIENILTTKITALSYEISCVAVDTDGDSMNLTLYYANNSIIYIWENLTYTGGEPHIGEFYDINLTDYNTEYTFYFNVTDGEDTVRSDNFTITTEMYPFAPIITDPTPEDDATDVSINTTLSIYVSDAHYSYNVTFYWLNNSVIQSFEIVENGTIVETDILQLAYATEYGWYVKLISSNNNIVDSSVFTFTIEDEPISPEESTNDLRIPIIVVATLVTLLALISIARKKRM